MFRTICVVLLSATVADFAVADMPQNIQQFLSEYQRAKGALADRYGRADIVFEHSGPVVNGMREVNTYRTKLDGDKYLVQPLERKSISTVDSKITSKSATATVSGRNSRYEFEADVRAQGNVVRKVTEVGGSGDKPYKLDYSHLSFPYISYSHAASYYDVVTSPDFAVTSAMPARYRDLAVFQIKGTSTTQFAQGNDLIVNYTFHFLPTCGYICVGCQFSRVGGKSESQYVCNYVDYKSMMPDIAGLEYTSRSGDNPPKLISLLVVKSVTPGTPLTDAECSLSAFGLPEPAGVSFTARTPTYVWLLLAAAMLAGLAVAFRQLQRRANSRAASPAPGGGHA